MKHLDNPNKTFQQLSIPSETKTSALHGSNGDFWRNETSHEQLVLRKTRPPLAKSEESHLETSPPECSWLLNLKCLHAR